MAAPLPASLIPSESDTWHAEREKAELAARLAKAFIDTGNGQGVEGMLAVMVVIATDEKVNKRTRSRTAAAYVKLAIEASQRGFKGIALQQNFGNGAPAPATPGAPVRDRAFWEAVLSNPDARKELLAGLSAEVGVAPPIKATRPGTAEKTSAAEVATKDDGPAQRKTRARAKPSTNGHATNGHVANGKAKA